MPAQEAGTVVEGGDLFDAVVVQSVWQSAQLSACIAGRWQLPVHVSIDGKPGRNAAMLCALEPWHLTQRPLVSVSWPP